MVAGRVHLRLGQGRDAILGPRPSLLETSILPRRPPWGIFHRRWGWGSGSPPLPSPPAGHTCSCAAQPVSAQRHDSGSARTCCWPFLSLLHAASYYSTVHCLLLCTPIPLPFNVSGSIDRTVVTLTQAEAVFTGTVLSCEAAAGARLS